MPIPGATTTPEVKRTSYAGEILQIFIPILLVLIFILGVFFYLEYSVETELLAERENNQVLLGSRSITRILENIAKDVHVLSQSTNLQNLLNGQGPQSKRQLEEEFLNFARNKASFDQIRFLDTTGKEVVRVNYNRGSVAAVSEEKLQNKGTRYYFRDTFKLDPGTLFISPFDLNVEQGRIEQPLKPMIRVGTPVFDTRGEKRGIVLVNYFGNELVAYLKSAMSGSTGGVMLLNSDGYWLSAPSPADEWGFMFKNERRFSTRYPDVWQEMLAQDSSQRTSEAGIFTWRTVYPLSQEATSSTGSVDPDGASGAAVGNQEYFWKVVSHVPQEILDRASLKRLGYGLALLLALSLLALIGSVFMASARLQEKAAILSLRRNEQRLRSITSELAEGLIVLDADGNLVMMNHEAEEILGWREKHLKGQPLLDQLLEAESGKPGANPIEDALDLHKVYRVEEGVFRRQDGSSLPVTYTAAPVSIDDTLHGVVVAFQDITDRKRMQDELKRMATHDALTGLCNRRMTEEFLKQSFIQAQRYKKELAICMLDIDLFKQVNDSHGHQIGDQVLREVSQIISNMTRDADCAGRYGGEEFILVLPETPVEGALALAERIRSQVAHNTVLEDEQGNPLKITISAGVAGIQEKIQGPDHLVSLADSALYHAKESGRNRVEEATYPL
ncbi:MAG: diguanylate cyclase [Candidatus Thiodiazotropha endolucinida]|nr:diguanylate cyclase [Candidatus Thiodiazotropha taylori]MCW4241507.1 diguanylate cyclase [Candidatus Thiodiazotropha taylori]